MSKINRRDFFKLSAIWGVMPIVLQGQDTIPEQEELPDESKENPWDEESAPGPYYFDGGVSIRYPNKEYAVWM